MEKDHGHTDFVDRMTAFAMHKASRRGAIKWLGKTGLALAASITAGIEFFRGTAFAGFPCAQYLIGCLGQCTCETSICTDQDGAGTQTCVGSCPGCGSDGVFYEAYIYWYWSNQLNKCVAVKSCVQCVGT